MIDKSMSSRGKLNKTNFDWMFSLDVWKMAKRSLDVGLRYSADALSERKEMFYLTTHSTHFILRLYGVRHMAKDHSSSDRGNRCHYMGYSYIAARFF